ETVDDSAVLVRFTYGGDANLDGLINVDDYGRIDLNIPLGSTGWFNGDFNDDGTINVDDYGIIDFNVGIQGPPLGSTLKAVNSPLTGSPQMANPFGQREFGYRTVTLLDDQDSLSNEMFAPDP